MIPCGSNQEKSVDENDDSIDDKLVSLEPRLESTAVGVIIEPTGPSRSRTTHAIQNSDITSVKSRNRLPGVAGNTSSIFCEPISCHVSSTSLEHYIPYGSCSMDTNFFPAEQYTFSPIIQSTSATSNVDPRYDYDNSEVFGTAVRRSSNLPSPDLSTGSNTSALLDKLTDIPANADER